MAAQRVMHDDDNAVDPRWRDLQYRGFDISVAASFRFGGIFVSARLTGGPNHIARQLGLPSAESTVERACEVAIADICDLIDRLLADPRALPGADAE